MMHKRMKMRKVRSSKRPRTHVNAAVGTLVWIRRRNGSWWPGRIISTDELSSTHIMSQRSGTPVKLLGREDASVDWYNVEKSKRVKAFRCGEFDECIEAAKALGGVSGKRREKYARREDAILDALELEKKQLELVACLSEACSPNRNAKAPTKQEKYENVVTSITSESSFDPASVDKADIRFSRSIQKHGKSNVDGVDIDLEDEGTGSVPRMKGLRDLGMISSRRDSKKHEISTVQTAGCEPSLLSEACARPSPGTRSASHSSKSFSPCLKKKPTTNRCCEEGGPKRRDRRKPLTQVLESMTHLATPAPTNGELDKCHNHYAEQSKVVGTSDASFQPSSVCEHVSSTMVNGTSSQKQLIKFKDEGMPVTKKSASCGAPKLETDAVCLISNSASIVPPECVTARRRKVSCVSLIEKDHSLVSSSISSVVCRPSTFITSAYTSASAMDCLSCRESHLPNTINGVGRQSCCVAFKDYLGKGCEESLSSKNTNCVRFTKGSDGLNLMNGPQVLTMGTFRCDSSYMKLEGGKALSCVCCSMYRNDDQMEDENTSLKTSDLKEEVVLDTVKYQDSGRPFTGASMATTNRLNGSSDASLVKQSRQRLCRCSTYNFHCQGGLHSGVSKRPKLGLQSTLKGEADSCLFEEPELVPKSMEHERHPTLASGNGTGARRQSASTDEGNFPVREHNNCRIVQCQTNGKKGKLCDADCGVAKSTCQLGKEERSTICQASLQGEFLNAQPPLGAVQAIEKNTFGSGLRAGVSTHGFVKRHCKVCQGKGKFQANFMLSKAEDDLICQGTEKPMVSLFSGVTGRGVVGLPVQVEVLDVIDSAGFLANMLQPVWRTARRTARQRVPRSSTDRAIELSRFCLERNEELKCKVKRVGVSKRKYSRTNQCCSLPYVSTIRRGFCRGALASKSCSYSDKEIISKKLLKKACLSSKRTRILSSISETKDGNEPFDENMNLTVGVVQTGDKDAQKVVDRSMCSEHFPTLETVHATRVNPLAFGRSLQKEVATCVPVSTVFSRLKAVVCV